MRMRKLRGPHKKQSMPFENFRTKTQPVNLSDLEERFDSGAEVTPESLKEKGLAKRQGPGQGPRPRRDQEETRGPRARFQRGRQGEDRSGRRFLSHSGAVMLRTILNAFSVAEIRKKLAFTAAMLALYRLGAYIPAPGVDANAVKEISEQLRRLRRPRLPQPLLRRQPLAAQPLRAGDHALHHGLDHPAAADRGRALARAPAERGRSRAAEDHPVHALPDRRPRLRRSRSATSSSSAPSATRPAPTSSATSPSRRSS